MAAKLQNEIFESRSDQTQGEEGNTTQNPKDIS